MKATIQIISIIMSCVLVVGCQDVKYVARQDIKHVSKTNQALHSYMDTSKEHRGTVYAAFLLEDDDGTRAKKDAALDQKILLVKRHKKLYKLETLLMDNSLASSSYNRAFEKAYFSIGADRKKNFGVQLRLIY